MTIGTRIAVFPIAVMLAIGAGLSTAALAGAQSMPSMISGAYVNEEAGIEIVFPDGWEGMEISSAGVTIVSVYPGGLEGASGEGIPASMMLMVGDKGEAEEPDPSEPQNVPEDGQVDCGTATVGNVNVAGVTAVQSVIECTVDGTTIKTKTVIVDTEARFVVAGFTASSAEYDQNIGEFDSSLATLEVDGAVNAEGMPGGSIDVDVGLELTAMTMTVSIAGENIDVDLQSSSTISNFQLDEESKTISFTVDGEDGTEGTTEIAIGSVLEGPYTVMVDGEVTSDFAVAEVDGETVLTVSYMHSTHDVTVTGTNVVPEFPVGVIGAVAAVIGIVAVITRTKFAGAFRQQ
jgi:hypothetical protein